MEVKFAGTSIKNSPFALVVDPGVSNAAASTFTKVCMYVCMYACVCACVCVFVCVMDGCIYVCVYTCMYVCVHVYIYVCIYVHMHMDGCMHCIHTRIYIHTYIHTYIYRSLLWLLVDKLSLLSQLLMPSITSIPVEVTHSQCCSSLQVLTYRSVI